MHNLISTPSTKNINQHSTSNIHLPHHYTLLSHNFTNPSNNLFTITLQPYHFTYPPNHNYPNKDSSIYPINYNKLPPSLFQLLTTNKTTFNIPSTTPIYNSNNNLISPTSYLHIHPNPQLQYYPNITLNLSLTNTYTPFNQHITINSIHFISPQTTTTNNLSTLI